MGNALCCTSGENLEPVGQHPSRNAQRHPPDIQITFEGLGLELQNSASNLCEANDFGSSMQHQYLSRREQQKRFIMKHGNNQIVDPAGSKQSIRLFGFELHRGSLCTRESSVAVDGLKKELLSDGSHWYQDIDIQAMEQGGTRRRGKLRRASREEKRGAKERKRPSIKIQTAARKHDQVKHKNRSAQNTPSNKKCLQIGTSSPHEPLRSSTHKKRQSFKEKLQLAVGAELNNQE